MIPIHINLIIQPPIRNDQMCESKDNCVCLKSANMKESAITEEINCAGKTKGDRADFFPGGNLFLPFNFAHMWSGVNVVSNTYFIEYFC